MKKGFTLAEVLITLGIIGVVAAVTLPVLTAKYQMKAFETGFKKQYSVLNNTISFVQLEEGISTCYVKLVCGQGNCRYSSGSDECSSLKLSMIDKLKLVPIENDFVYAKTADVIAGGGVAINSTVAYELYKNFSAYMLPDGAVLIFEKPGAISTSYYGTAVIVDVNGKKGPNKWGYDVFWLTLVMNNNKLRLTDEYASLAQKGGRLPRTILMNKDKNDSTGWYW